MVLAMKSSIHRTRVHIHPHTHTCAHTCTHTHRVLGLKLNLVGSRQQLSWRSSWISKHIWEGFLGRELRAPAEKAHTRHTGRYSYRLRHIMWLQLQVISSTHLNCLGYRNRRNLRKKVNWSVRDGLESLVLSPLKDHKEQVFIQRKRKIHKDMLVYCISSKWLKPVLFITVDDADINFAFNWLSPIPMQSDPDQFSLLI